MRKGFLNHLGLLLLFTCVFLHSSCSEDTGEPEEFDNWKARNAQCFDKVYHDAKSEISGGNPNWKILTTWSKNEGTTNKPEDHIVVNVLKEGTGSGCPLYTDTVKVHIKGRLMQSRSYSDGYVFTASYPNELVPDICVPVKYGANGSYKERTGKNNVIERQIDGLGTAFQNMRIGDRWIVYVPYQLGFGEHGNTASRVPAYSMLIYDVMLVGYYRSGSAD